jgi:hypothetical protein
MNGIGGASFVHARAFSGRQAKDTEPRNILVLTP